MDSSASSPPAAPSGASTTTQGAAAAASPSPTQLGGQNHHSASPQPSPRPLTRSEPANPYPTTFVQADTTSFKQVVQMLTGSVTPSAKPDPNAPPPAGPTVPSRLHSIPPIKPSMAKKPGSGFKLYERRNSLNNLKINPLHPLSGFPGQPNSGFSPLKPEILSPSVLDFPALALSPVTPLTHDPFARSSSSMSGPNCHNYSYASPEERSGGSVSPNVVDSEAEERGIREKGFFLHPSPSTTPRDAEPRLLPLFTVTSPRVSGE